MTTCGVEHCDRPPDGAYVCRVCTATVERVLAETPWLLDELTVVITRQSRYGTASAYVTGGTMRPLMFDLRASDVRATLVAQLTSWVLLLAEQNPGWRLPVDTGAAKARWLLCRLDTIRHHELGGLLVGELCETRATAVYAVDRPAERIYAGPCDCGEDMYGKPGAIDVMCRGCQRIHTIAEMQDWMRAQVADRLVTAREGATLLSRLALETNQATIEKWHQRSRLEGRGADKAGRRLFRFNDLLALAAQSPRHAAQG